MLERENSHTRAADGKEHKLQQARWRAGEGGINSKNKDIQANDQSFQEKEVWRKGCCGSGCWEYGRPMQCTAQSWLGPCMGCRAPCGNLWPQGGEGKSTFVGEGEAVSWTWRHQRQLRSKLHFISSPGTDGPHVASPRAVKKGSCHTHTHTHITWNHGGDSGCSSRAHRFPSRHLPGDSEPRACSSVSEVTSWKETLQ